jgi:hypothetical protein
MIILVRYLIFIFIGLIASSPIYINLHLNGVFNNSQIKFEIIREKNIAIYCTEDNRSPIEISVIDLTKDYQDPRFNEPIREQPREINYKVEPIKIIRQ